MKFSNNELGLIAAGGSMWFKMLKGREDRLLNKIYGEFRNGQTDHLANLAEFVCIRDQINELTVAMKQFEHQKGQGL